LPSPVALRRRALAPPRGGRSGGGEMPSAAPHTAGATALRSASRGERMLTVRLERPLTVAIDGPAGAGKSTVARAVARALGYTYIDSGAMYRAATLNVLRR